LLNISCLHGNQVIFHRVNKIMNAELASVLIAMFAALTALGSAYFTYKSRQDVAQVKTETEGLKRTVQML